MLTVHRLVRCCYLFGYCAWNKHYTVVIRNKIIVLLTDVGHECKKRPEM